MVPSSTTDPVQRFQFLTKVKTISLREFVRANFRIFSVFNIYIRTTWLLCSVLTRPSTLVAIYFDKRSHIPASNVIKAVRHNAPLSLLYKDGHPRCKGFRFGVKSQALDDWTHFFFFFFFFAFSPVWRPLRYVYAIILP